AAVTDEGDTGPDLHIPVEALDEPVFVGRVPGAHFAVEIARIGVVVLLNLRGRRAGTDDLPLGRVGGKLDSDQDVVVGRGVAAALEQEPRLLDAGRAARIVRDGRERAEILLRHAGETEVREPL